MASLYRKHVLFFFLSAPDLRYTLVVGFVLVNFKHLVKLFIRVDRKLISV